MHRAAGGAGGLSRNSADDRMIGELELKYTALFFDCQPLRLLKVTIGEDMQKNTAALQLW